MSRLAPLVIENPHLPLVRLRYASWMALMDVYQSLSPVFKITDIGSIVMSFLTAEEFRKITICARMMLVYREPSILDPCPDHLNHNILPFKFIKKRTSFSLFCCSNDAVAQKTYVLKTPSFYQSFITSNGKYIVLACAGDDGLVRGGIRVYDKFSGECIRHFKPSGSYEIRQVNTNPNGKFIVVSQSTQGLFSLDYNYYILIYSIDSGRCMHKLSHTEMIYRTDTNISMSCDGNHIISHHSYFKKNTGIKIWDFHSGERINNEDQVLRIFDKHESDKKMMPSFTNKGKKNKIEAESNGGVIRIFNVDTNTTIKCMKTKKLSSSPEITFVNDELFVFNSDFKEAEIQIFSCGGFLHKEEIQASSDNHETCLR